METKKIMFTAAVIFALLITIGSAFAVLPNNLEITDIKVGKTGETLVSYDDGNETAAFQPGDEITVKMKVKNNGLVTIENLVITALVDAELTDFPSTPAPSHLLPNQEKEVTYTYEIPAGLDTVDGLETYSVEFNIEGEDEANNPFGDSQSFLLKVEQKLNNVVVDNLKLYVGNVEKIGQLTCQEKQLSIQVKAKLVNNGLEDPTDVIVTLTNQALGMDLEQNTTIETESNNPADQVVIFTLSPANVAAITGQHQLTLKVYRENQFPDKVYDAETLTVSGEDCIVNIASASPQSPVVVDKQETQAFNVEVNNPQDLDLTYEWSVDTAVQNEATNTFVLDPAPTGLNLSLGQHTVKVSITGQDVNLEKLWNVEVADNPADFTISEIVFADVELGADDLTKQVTIKNIGSSEQLTNVQVAFVDVASKYGAAFTDGLSTLEQTLDAGEQASVTIQLDIPEDEDGGVIGKLKVTGTDANDTPVVKEANIVVHPKNYLKVSSVKVNGKTNGGLSLSESNEIKVEVRNDYTKDLDDVRVTVALLDADGDDLESVEKDLFENGDSLGNGDEETVTLDLDLQNEDLDENEYTLEITVEGSEGSNDYTTVETLTVQVDRGDEEVAITKAELSSSKLQCSAKTTLYVTIKNNSDKEFNNLKLRVRSNDLNLDLSKSNIDLEDYSGNDNEYETTFDLELTYADADIYTLTVEVLDDNDVVASKDVELEVKECLGESTASGNKEYYADEKLKNELQKSLEEYRRAQAQPVVKASFRESGEYTMLL